MRFCTSSLFLFSFAREMAEPRQHFAYSIVCNTAITEALKEPGCAVISIKPLQQMWTKHTPERCIARLFLASATSVSLKVYISVPALSSCYSGRVGARRKGPCLSSQMHTMVQDHRKCWEAGWEQRNRACFQFPQEPLHEKCISSSPGMQRIKEKDIEKCKRKKLQVKLLLPGHLLRMKFLFHFPYLFFTIQVLFLFYTCCVAPTVPSCCRDQTSSTHNQPPCPRAPGTHSWPPSIPWDHQSSCLGCGNSVKLWPRTSPRPSV